jgi:hypothetical protein
VRTWVDEGQDEGKLCACFLTGVIFNWGDRVSTSLLKLRFFPLLFGDQEEELRTSEDPKNAHLRCDPYVDIVVRAPPAEAYARLAHALTEIRPFLTPVSSQLSIFPFFVWRNEHMNTAKRAVGMK